MLSTPLLYAPLVLAFVHLLVLVESRTYTFTTHDPNLCPWLI